MNTAQKLTAIAENQQKVYDSGHKKGMTDEQMRFWKVYQNNGNRNLYQYAFYDYLWNDEIYNPLYPIKSINANSIFQSSSITDTKVTMDLSSCTSTAYYTFSNCTKLTTVRKLIVNETLGYYDFWYNCKSLTNVTIEGVIGKSMNLKYSPLSVESMKSVISCLKDYSSENTGVYTLTLKDECKAALEAEGATSPNGNLWTEYVSDLGWVLA